MKKYKVTTQVIYHVEFEIEADSAQEACTTAEGLTMQGEGAHVVVQGPTCIEFYEL